MTKPLSVIMPAYNEADCIADAVAEVVRDVLDLVPEAELVVVNDGSKDRTGAILDEIAAADLRVRVVHQPNGGHGRALRTGLDTAQAEYLFLIDSDRQIPLQAFADFWEDAKRGDGSFGIRIKRSDPPLRLVLTRLIRYSLAILFGVRIYDANIPFKVIRRQVWEKARPLIPEDTLAPSLFLAIFAVRTGCEIVFREVSHRERETGVVSIRRWKLLKFCARALRQMIAFQGRLAIYCTSERAGGSVSQQRVIPGPMLKVD
jgi:glycosyltransferase involved in cell wall biosynthesis